MLTILPVVDVQIVFPFLFKVVADDLPLAVGFLESAVFGIHFSDTSPGRFLRAAVINPNPGVN